MIIHKEQLGLANGTPTDPEFEHNKKREYPTMIHCRRYPTDNTIDNT